MATPMMQQYQAIKKDHPDAILFFRLGDFYEMFGEDAELGSRELEITLTGRESGGVRIPMCGVPFHAAEGYISRLIEKGYKVAVCEQVEDASASKGIVRREVTRIITPGTILDANLLEEKNSRYLAAIYKRNDMWGIALADVSTGELLTACWHHQDELSLQTEILRMQPMEILIEGNDASQLPSWLEICKSWGCLISCWHGQQSQTDCEKIIIQQLGISSIEEIQLPYHESWVAAAANIIDYLKFTQKISLRHINGIRALHQDAVMFIDINTRRNLELTRSLKDGSRKGSLLDVLDRTLTSMGGRLLKRWLEQPLIDAAAIQVRLDCVDYFAQEGIKRSDVRSLLKSVLDLERLSAKVSFASANGRDLLALAKSILQVPKIKNTLADAPGYLGKLAETTDGLEDVAKQIEDAIDENAPVGVRDGCIIRTGFHPEVDELRSLAERAKDYLTGIEVRERQRTGIRSLKVSFNKVFGYYIEITKANLALVPNDYIRKQTLSTGERYITPELKEYETKILGAEERLKDLEYQLFNALRWEVEKAIPRIQKTAQAIAQIDVFSAFGQISVEQGYCRPQINSGYDIRIEGGRHPVVEAFAEPGTFVPNHTVLTSKERFILLTGPNMAGKSTYMRQVALIVLMAQVGSHVPASEAFIGIVDRIFTRVGASDDLATGKSTFMVEMTEVANILNHATSRSLLILDEVGRGTSTYDGLAIAWSVVEEIHNAIKAKTLFATHYHELINLEQELDKLRNYHVAVTENQGDVVFLHLIRRGATDKSYGLHVAKIAGITEHVLQRAKTILKDLEANLQGAANPDIAASKTISPKQHNIRTEELSAEEQLLLFAGEAAKPKASLEEQLLREISKVDINRMTPIEALNLITRWQGTSRRSRQGKKREV